MAARPLRSDEIPDRWTKDNSIHLDEVYKVLKFLNIDNLDSVYGSLEGFYNIKREIGEEEPGVKLNNGLIVTNYKLRGSINAFLKTPLKDIINKLYLKIKSGEYKKCFNLYTVESIYKSHAMLNIYRGNNDQFVYRDDPEFANIALSTRTKVEFDYFTIWQELP
jgi:hypothetical protein